MYYDDDYDEENAPPVSMVGICKADILAALVLGGLSFLMLQAWGYPAHPAGWTDAAVAAGTRPPPSILPGLWTFLSAGVFRALGVAKTLFAYTALGRALGAASVALVYLFFREFLSISVRHRKQAARRRLFVVRAAAAVATCAFACSEPYWRMAQTFSSATLVFFVSAAALTLFAVFLRNGSLAASYLCVFLGGVVSGETPFGLVCVLCALAAYWFITRFGEQFAVPLVSPAAAQVSKWHLTFLFVLGALCAIGLNCTGFVRLGGLDAAGAPGYGALALMYVQAYGALFTDAADLTGWLFLSVVIILPWFVCAAMLPKATDEEHFLNYGIGLVYVVAFLFAIFQFAPFHALWVWGYWELFDAEIVHSPLLMLVMALLAAASVMGAVAVLGVDCFCRDHKFIAHQQFGEIEETDEDGYAPPRRRPSRRATVMLGRFSRAVVVLIMLVPVPALTVPSRRCAKAREMLGVVADYVDLVLDECADRAFVFTDGRFDAGLELGARARGRTLAPLSMMSGKGRYDAYLRQRGVDEGEERLAAAMGAPALLRTWLHDRPAALSNCCAQIGLEFWKREGRPLPPMLGVSGRPDEADAAFPEACAARGRALAARISAFYARHGGVASNDRLAEELFQAVQWRLSRIARFRAEARDLAGDTAGARAEVELADGLDKANADLKHLLDALERARQNARTRLRPREGLRQALEDANFALARQYAEPVLETDPENADANFAMGMLYMQQGQFARAEESLVRCLVRAPRQPAVYNNLAMIQLELRKYAAAEKNARRALELAPGSAEITDTLRRVAEARAGAVTNAPAARPDPQEKP